MARLDGGRGEGPEGLGVGVEDGSPAPGQQGLEQPQLGRPVAVHVPVIVQVILGEVQEACGLEGHAVQPALVDAVGRGLQGQVGDAHAGQLRQKLGHVPGVRRGQAGRRQLHIQVRPRGQDAERPHAGGAAPGAGEDLAAEGGDRGLAVGTRDRHAHRRLRAPEAGGGQGVGPAGIGDLQDRNLQPVNGRSGEDGGCAGLDGLGGEGRAVGLGAWQGGEQEAGLDLAAVSGDAGDLGILVQVAGQQGGQTGH